MIAITEGTIVQVIETGETAPVAEITSEGGREEIMIDLGDAWIGFQRSELIVIAPAPLQPERHSTRAMCSHCGTRVFVYATSTNGTYCTLCAKDKDGVPMTRPQSYVDATVKLDALHASLKKAANA